MYVRKIMMNRLTDKRFTGDGFTSFSSPEWKRILSHIPSLKDVYTRLAEYEDTGLTPDEILTLKEQCDKKEK